MSAAPATEISSRGHGLLILSTLVAALGGLLFGFDTAVISGTTEDLAVAFDLSNAALGFTVAAALVGTILGSIGVGKPADAWGRRAVLLITAILFTVSAIGSAVAPEWYSFLLFRFIGGIGVGAASVVSPMYIAEIAPARLRGRLVAVTQFNIVLGILLAFFSNFWIAQGDLEEFAWRWMFGVEAAPAIAFGLLLFLVPRSPRWLMTKRREPEARAVLERLGHRNVVEELAEIRESIDLQHHQLDEPFFGGTYRKPILLAVAIAAFNQLSGINALMYYAPAIFKMAGVGTNQALLQTVAIGGTNLLFTMLAMAIIDSFGRRRLMLIGSLGYILSLGVTAGAFYAYGAEFRTATQAADAVERAEQIVARSPGDATAVGIWEAAQSQFAVAAEAASMGSLIVMVSLVVFIASHAFGQGAVIWVFISEIFPNRVRARGQALGSFTHWVMAALISWTFPMMAEWSGGHIFAFYALMMVGQLLWVLLVMPETKGVPLEEIQKRLGIR